ncbi:MAG: hypothetical protein IJ228_01685 [Succinivibrio sp.]|nr:hypothetical protein [Succinivibrio sp.]
MEALSTPLRTAMSVFYITRASGSETDISLDVSADLLSCSYTDKIDDEADEVSLTLKDETGKWAGSWSPTRGDFLRVIFANERGEVDTGKMSIDELRTSGRPRVFEVRGVNVPLDNTIRRTMKTRTFEQSTLSAIGAQIADTNGLSFKYDCEDDPEYDRSDQKDESDLAYLKRLCKDAGYSVKIFDGLLYVFDQKSFESKPAVKTIEESGGTVLSWNFQAQQSERYKAVTVKWRDVSKKTRSGSSPKTDEVSLYLTGKGSAKAEVAKGNTAVKQEYVDYTYTDDSVDESGQIYVLKKRCTNLGEAERLARAKLRELNLRQLTGSLSVIGDPALQAGTVVELKSFGSFDGNFIVESASHSMSGSGYVTSIEVRRVNVNY